MKRVAVIVAVLFLMVSVAQAASPKSYQVTGQVLEVKDDIIVVDKAGEKWEIAKDKDTKVSGGEAKVGSKVTIQYRMSAKEIEVKDAPKKDEKKDAKKEAPAKKK
jgi:RNase P/RNase MRP subunit p29